MRMSTVFTANDARREFKNVRNTIIIMVKRKIFKNKILKFKGKTGVTMINLIFVISMFVISLINVFFVFIYFSIPHSNGLGLPKIT